MGRSGERYVSKITGAPRPLAAVLGVRSDTTAVLLGLPAEYEAWLTAQLPDGVDLHRELTSTPVDVVIVWADGASELAAVGAEALRVLKSDAALWTVVRKKGAVADRAPGVEFAAAQGALLPLGLVDNKECALTQDTYAVRFVVRRELRQGRAGRDRDPSAVGGP